MPSLVVWVILFRYERTCRNFPSAGARKDDLLVNLEGKKLNKNMLVTSSRWNEHQGPGIASCHSLCPLDVLISLLSLAIISLFLLILISVSLLSWSLWSSSCSNSRCSLNRTLLFIWTVALATPCTNARGLLFVDSKDSTLQGLMFPK